MKLYDRDRAFPLEPAAGEKRCSILTRLSVTTCVYSTGLGKPKFLFVP